MPLYIFQCSHCQNTFENLQKMSDEHPKTIPGCTSNACKLTKILAAPNFSIKSANPLSEVAKKQSDKGLNLFDNNRDSSKSTHECKPGCSFHS